MKKLKYTLLSLALLCGMAGTAQASHKASPKAKTTHARSAAKVPAHKVAHGKAAHKNIHAAHGKAIRHLVAAPVAPRVLAPLASEGDVSGLPLHSASALVIDQTTGMPLLQKNPDAVVPIASISKLMTAMVVLDARLDLHEIISIDEADVDTLRNTRSRLQVGSTLTRETALLLALMSSDNRAAHALGRHYPGGIGAFVAAMNRKAKSLGMSRTFFEEPTGLSSNNVSTARDLAKMVQAAQDYPQIREASTTAEARVDLGTHLTDFHNSNALVRGGEWEIGLSKTGFINAAGRCLVMQAKVANKPVVIVLLDSAGKATRLGDANRIKRWMEESTGLSGLPQAFRAG